jgi:hypothetical protein
METTMIFISDLSLTTKHMVKNNLSRLGLIIVVIGLSSFTAVAIEPRVVPSFVIDFDQPASSRYDEIFSYFYEPLQEMEHYFYFSIPQTKRDFYGEGENLRKF